MEAIKKQATKLREQVAKQQQAILRQLGHLGYEAALVDDAELQSRKLAEDCCKYGTENQSAGSPLARAASQFGTSHRSMENERETVLGILGSQVSEPLRASITGAPLEDARHLTHRYDRLRQEVETQVGAEKSYHQNIIATLDELHAERDADVSPVLDGPDVPQDEHQNDSYFIAKVAPTGWSEGECKGEAGWFLCICSKAR
ncbi:SH3 domain-containing protein 1 [Camellia lanceoleosa]|uniref:SH3 domain-containing protein 1 n=1 Tax=Camellia lanceoleosa TaxID=1840588 RepID=A0ACC0FJL7_9ERIC|nr:SH3 domain-containing protein 1 [Camellia lanceoleosa]